VKKDPAVIGCHIYSLEPSLLKDISILSVSNFEASQLQQGKDINLYRVVHNNDAILSKPNVRSTPSTSSVSSSSAAKAAAAATPGLSGSKPGLTSTSSLSNAALDHNPATPSSTPSKTKSAPAAKSSMMNFFGKATAAKAPIPATTSSASKPAAKNASSTLNFKPAPQKRKADSMMSPNNNNMNNDRNNAASEENDSDEDVDSEEERDRRLALSSRMDQDQGDIGGPENNDKSASIKKKPRSARVLVLDDDDEEEDQENNTRNRPGRGAMMDEDDEDESVETMSKEARLALNKEKEAQRLALENMMLMDKTTAGVVDEDSPMVDVEALDQPEPSPASEHGESTITNQGTVTTRRKRGMRAVTKRKTYRNDRGYMVTEDIVVMEPFSEDEIIPVAAPAAAPARVEKAVEPKGKSESGPKKKGSGNQSLLNFFSKK
ncbi:hypothetical protein BGZ51_004240, partial [Haplosporangium sp. Z 767]